MRIAKGQLEQLLRDKDFRSQFTADFVRELLSAQIRALRDKRGWNQKELGANAGKMEQAQVSRLEDPEYSGGTLNSVIRIAQGFDVGLLVQLVPFSRVVEAANGLNPNTLIPPSYQQEMPAWIHYPSKAGD